MPDPLTPNERIMILRGVEEYVHRLRLDAELPERFAVAHHRPYDAQFVRESIADACHAIDAAVADVPTEEEIAHVNRH